MIFSGNQNAERGQVGGGRLVDFRNDSGEEIPAFAVMRITGGDLLDDGEVFLVAAKPNTYGSQYRHAINGPLAVASGSYGVCTFDDIGVGLFDDADGTPAAGELWGPRSGTWKLKKNTGGFMVLKLVNTSEDLVLVTRAPFLRFHGVTDAAIAKDASGTVSIFYGTGAGTDSTVNMSSVYNSYGDVAISKDVECFWEGDLAGTSWRFIAAECA